MKSATSLIFALGMVALFLFSLLRLGPDPLAQWFLCICAACFFVGYLGNAWLEIAGKGGQ